MDPQQIDNEQQGIDNNNPNNVQPEEDITTNRDAFYARYRFYQPRVAIGEGRFGQVYLVWDTVEGTDVVLKRFNTRGAYQLESFERELRILEQIGLVNDHTVSFLNHYHNPQISSSSYLVLNLMWRTLDFEVQRIGEMGDLYSLDTIRTLGLQIASGLQFLEGLNIIHADLRPENLMFTNGYEQLRIIDFGHAFVMGTEINHSIQTTPEYRAMEVYLDLGPYTNAIDIWSFGCILGYMYSAQSLFIAETKNNIDREIVYEIVRTFGWPHRDILRSSHMSVQYFDYNNDQWKMKLGRWNRFQRRPGSHPIQQILDSDGQERLSHEFIRLVRLIERMMDYNVNTRINIANIIRHDFFTNPRAPP